MKEKIGKFTGKAMMMIALVMMAFTPTVVGASSPSGIVNGVTDGFWSEVQDVTPGAAIAIIGFLLVMYFIPGDEHKKSKYKSGIAIVLVCSLLILFLPSLYNWFTGLA